MLDVIAKSKKFKYERQKEKEVLLNEFEKFDDEFKAIRALTKNYDRTQDQKVVFFPNKNVVFQYFLFLNLVEFFLVKCFYLV